MATWDDVRRLVAELPDTDEHPSYDSRPAWRVRQKAFVWERPLSGPDRAALGPGAPADEEPLLAVRLAGEGVKAELVADEPDIFLTTPHFDRHPVVLLRLDRVAVDELAEVVEDAWRARAPKRLVTDFDHRRTSP